MTTAPVSAPTDARVTTTMPGLVTVPGTATMPGDTSEPGVTTASGTTTSSEAATMPGTTTARVTPMPGSVTSGARPGASPAVGVHSRESIAHLRQPLPGARPGTAPEPTVTLRLRRLPVPVREPIPARHVRDGDRPAVPPTQGTLALTMPMSQHVSETFERPADAGSVPAEHQEWALTFAQAAMEVEAGLRSPGQLVRWTSLDVQARLVRRGALAARARRSGAARGAKPSVRSLRMSSPRHGVYEAAAVIAAQDRVRAIAFRMENVDGRWRVTELEIG